MFLGHFGVGFAAKKADKHPSLGTYILAAQFLDFLWPVLLLFGIERVKVVPGITSYTPLDFIYYPFSHSLLTSILWGVLFGLIYYIIKKNLRASIILGILVPSHWILDLIVHRPDLPLVPGGDIYAGFGLWNSVALSIIIEIVIFSIGIIYYSTVTRPLNKKGSIGWWSMVAFLAIVFIMNINSIPPDDQKAIGWVSLSLWLLVPWGYFIDKNREARE